MESFVSSPNTVYLYRLTTDRRNTYAGSVFTHLTALAVIAALCVLALSAALSFGGGSDGLSVVMFVIAVILPFRLLREFARRYNFAELKVGRVIAIDTAVSTLHLAILSTLVLTGYLTAASTFSAIGIACAVVGVAWFLKERSAFRFQLDSALDSAGQSWTLGRWLCASQVLLIVGAESIPWILAFTLGKVATGVFAACATLAHLSGPLVNAVNNVLAPRVSAAYADGGAKELHRVVIKTMLFLSGTLLLFSVAMVFVGELLISFLFGATFAGYGWIVVVLTLSEIARGGKMVLSRGLIVLERSDLQFRVQIVNVIVTLSACAALVKPFGIAGAAIGHAAGSIAAVALMLFLYQSTVRQAREDESSRTSAAVDNKCESIVVPVAPEETVVA
jgi:O-antigen/teichoic acid export membrane protein